MRRGCVALGTLLQGSEVIILIARIERLVDDLALDHAVLIDDERAACGKAQLIQKDPVLTAHGAVRPEVGKERGWKAIVFLELL